MNMKLSTVLNLHEVYMKHKDELIHLAQTIAMDQELPKDDADRYSRWIWEIVDRLQQTFHDSIMEEI